MIYRFANIMAFQWLWLVPVIIIVSWLLYQRQRKKMNSVFGKRLTPFLTASVSSSKRKWKLILEVGVVLFFVVSLARPQSGQNLQKIKSEGIELVLMVDVSNSMLAEDAKPSRLELIKKELGRFLDLNSGDRIGLIAFAGSAAVLTPVTTDKAALKMYIDSLSPYAVSTQGTEFRKALKEAENAFVRGGVEDGEKSVVTRAVVIASDGEDNEPGALVAAKELRKQGIHIFTLGVGTEKGGAIPVRDRTGQLRGYRKDRSGKVILTRTTGKVLKVLAQEGGGSFHHVTFGGTVIRQLRDDLKKLEQKIFNSAEITNYQEKYQSFLFMALILAFIELLFGERRVLGRIWKGRYEVSEG